MRFDSLDITIDIYTHIVEQKIVVVNMFFNKKCVKEKHAGEHAFRLFLYYLHVRVIIGGMIK